MIKYKYLRLNKYKKLRYLSINEKSKNFVVFLHGFMSDIEGSKPKNFLRYCKSKKIGFLTFEYSGHGKSSGKFTKGNISKWTYETKKIIRRIVRNNNFILIGSSMGSWVSLNQFKYFSKQIKGFVGIGSAPEFLERLMWKKFTKKMKKEIKTNGIITTKHGQVRVTQPISGQQQMPSTVNPPPQLQSQMTNMKAQSHEFTIPQAPNFDNMYAGPETPLVGAANPQTGQIDNFEPMAANDGFGAFGTAF